MPTTAFTAEHRILIQALIDARKAGGLSQVELASRLGRKQSLVSNIERGERRVDVLEFYAIARAIGVDPVTLFAHIVKHLPHEISI